MFLPSESEFMHDSLYYSQAENQTLFLSTSHHHHQSPAIAFYTVMGVFLKGLIPPKSRQVSNSLQVLNNQSRSTTTTVADTRNTDLALLLLENRCEGSNDTSTR